MIFYTKYKIDDLFCPKCGSFLYRSTYFEHYPEYPYGCVKCDELIMKNEAKKQPPENINGAESDSASEIS
jgi:DNA-directed RNA polymerase subunit M/transcription elongation factor TFIIS